MANASRHPAIPLDPSENAMQGRATLGMPVSDIDLRHATVQLVFSLSERFWYSGIRVSIGTPRPVYQGGAFSVLSSFALLLQPSPALPRFASRWLHARRCVQYWTDGCLAPNLFFYSRRNQDSCVEEFWAMERISGPVPWRTRPGEADGTGERNEPRSDPENTAPRPSAVRGCGRAPQEPAVSLADLFR